MRRCPQGHGRSVDRGTSRPGIEPRNTPLPGADAVHAVRKATPRASPSRDARGPGEVKDPEHAGKLHAQELGDPVFGAGQGCRRPRREPTWGTTAMNEGGKSDRSVVPQTLSNKGGGAPTPAERAEGRGLAKDNPLQQNQSIGHRAAPDWQSALERIRQATSVCALRSEARARCGNSARRDLCGGRVARPVPTATRPDVHRDCGHVRPSPLSGLQH